MATKPDPTWSPADLRRFNDTKLRKKRLSFTDMLRWVADATDHILKIDPKTQIYYQHNGYIALAPSADVEYFKTVYENEQSYAVYATSELDKVK